MKIFRISNQQKINKFLIEDNIIKLFIKKFEKQMGNIWNSLETRSKKDSKEKNKIKRESNENEINEFIQKKFLNNIDKKLSKNYYISKNDIDLNQLQNNDNPDIQQIFRQYSHDELENELTKKINQNKKEVFNEWWNYLNENNYSPAFIYIIIHSFFLSDQKGQQTPPQSLNVAALNITFDKVIQENITNPEKIRNEYRTQKIKKQQGKELEDGWIKIPGKKEDPDNLDENADLLSDISCTSTWCIAGKETAKTYLEQGNFHILIDNGKAEVSLRTEGTSEIVEISGNLDENQQNVDPKYSEKIVDYVENNSELDSNSKKLKRFNDIASLNKDFDDEKAKEVAQQLVKNDYSSFKFLNEENQEHKYIQQVIDKKVNKAYIDFKESPDSVFYIIEETFGSGYGEQPETDIPNKIYENFPSDLLMGIIFSEENGYFPIEILRKDKVKNNIDDVDDWIKILKNIDVENYRPIPENLYDEITIDEWVDILENNHNYSKLMIEMKDDILKQIDKDKLYEIILNTSDIAVIPSWLDLNKQQLTNIYALKKTIVNENGNVIKKEDFLSELEIDNINKLQAIIILMRFKDRFFSYEELMNKIDYVDGKTLDDLNKYSKIGIEKILHFLTVYDLLNREVVLHYLKNYGQMTRSSFREEFIQFLSHQEVADYLVDSVINKNKTISFSVVKHIKEKPQLYKTILQEIYKNPLKALDNVTNWGGGFTGFVRFSDLIEIILDSSFYSLEEKRKTIEYINSSTLCKMNNDEIKSFYIKNTTESSVEIYHTIKDCIEEDDYQIVSKKFEKEVSSITKISALIDVNNFNNYYLSKLLNFIRDVPLSFDAYKKLFILSVESLKNNKKRLVDIEELLSSLIEKMGANILLNDQDLLKGLFYIIRSFSGPGFLSKYPEIFNSEKLKNIVKKYFKNYTKYTPINSSIISDIYFLLQRKKFFNIKDIIDILKVYQSRGEGVKNYLYIFNENDKKEIINALDINDPLDINGSFYSQSSNWYKIITFNKIYS